MYCNMFISIKVESKKTMSAAHDPTKEFHFLSENDAMMVVCYHSNQEFLCYLTLSVHCIYIPEVVIPLTFHLQTFSTWSFHLSGDWALIWVPICHLQCIGQSHLEEKDSI